MWRSYDTPSCPIIIGLPIATKACRLESNPSPIRGYSPTTVDACWTAEPAPGTYPAVASFSTSFITTIGIDFKIRTVELDGKRIKLQIWDTAGQERFRTITTAYYRGAMGILLVYDVTDESSFNNVRSWIRNIEQHASDSVNKILVGNKCDMEDKRQVPTSRGQALADEFGIQFFETSAKSNINVDKAFCTIARDIKARVAEMAEATRQESVAVKLEKGKANAKNNKKKPESGGCCGSA
eukprot:jgi/Mesvir1/18656/Mv17156-RA.1